MCTRPRQHAYAYDSHLVNLYSIGSDLVHFAELARQSSLCWWSTCRLTKCSFRLGNAGRSAAPRACDPNSGRSTDFFPRCRCLQFSADGGLREEYPCRLRFVCVRDSQQGRTRTYLGLVFCTLCLSSNHIRGWCGSDR